MPRRSIAVTLLVSLGVLALTGCQPPQDSATPAAPAGPTLPPLDDRSFGSTGLDIRYLDRDGTLKTLRVRDFPR